MVIILNLTELLTKNRNSRKIFGQKEIEIMLKQMGGEPLTQSERNRLSRDIKPKLQFIAEASRHQGEFNLRKNQDSKRLAEKAVDVILNDPLKDRIMAILLFGSVADKTDRKSSDIDICAVFREISLKEATQFRIRASGQLPEKIDVQVFNILPHKIKREIARNHKVLYSKAFDDTAFTIKTIKDNAYPMRIKQIFA